MSLGSVVKKAVNKIFETNKKRGGGPAKVPSTPVSRVSPVPAPRESTDLNEVFKIPVGFENYPPPKDGKLTKSYIDDLTEKLFDTYQKPDYDKLAKTYGPDKWHEVFYSNKKMFDEYMNVVDEHEGVHKITPAPGSGLGDHVEREYYAPTNAYRYDYKGPAVEDVNTITKDILQQYRGGRGADRYTGFGSTAEDFRDFMDPSNRGANLVSSARKYAEKVYKNRMDYRVSVQDRAKKDDTRDIATYLATSIAQKNRYIDLAKRTWGPDYASNDEYKGWIERTQEKFGDTVESSLSGMSKDGNIKNIKLPSTVERKPGRDVTKGFFDQIGDFFEGAVDFAVDLTTGIVEAPVTIGEAVDDIIEGKNVGEVLLDTTLKTTGIQDVVDAGESLMEGDVVGAVADTYEYAYGQQENIDQGSFVSGATPPTDIAATRDYIDTIADVSDPSKDNPLANLREDINEVFTGEDIPVEPEKEINMKPIEKTTMSELKALLGLAEDREDGAVIEALIGTEARKMADDPDIARLRELQGTVAERGYDVGEREALSAKARRELAGMARQQGMAAGAAAGGLRGASVAAQSRALAEKAMQKQADVTTEMDKASIARKDAARQQLATLAKDVTKFDIEKEQERKKRKGATTVGVQSLLSQEELAKQQMQIAQMD